MICWKCHKDLGKIAVFRQTECSFCSSSLHCCFACEFYEKGSHYDCHETVDSLVVDKDRANFCESFKPKENNIAASSGDEKNRADAAKAAFAALFS